jgi:hypothetical protein
MTGPVDLYDAFGEHLRHCPLGALQALETVRHEHTTAAYVRLSDDQRVIVCRWPGTVKVYSYEVRPAVSAQIVSFPSRQELAGERRGA